MTAAIDWSGLDLAGAFILGAVLATIATIRIIEIVDWRWRHRERDRND